MRKRRAVQNHIGTVHAIAMCNLAEIAAGTMTEISIPASMRWLPKGMQVEYLKKADSDVEAIATVAQIVRGSGARRGGDGGREGPRGRCRRAAR